MLNQAQIDIRGEVRSLSSASDVLAKRIDSGNTRYMWGGALAILIAIFVFYMQYRIIQNGRRLADVQGRLLGAKDRQLQADLSAAKQASDIEIAQLRLRAETAERNIAIAEAREKVAEAQIAEANGGITDAQAKAAIAQQSAAVANKAAEDERLERIKLETVLAPRRLTSQQVNAVHDALRDLRVHTVSVSSYALDAEGALLGKQLLDILQANPRLRVENGLLSNGTVGSVGFGVFVDGSDAHEVAKVKAVLGQIGGLFINPESAPPMGSGMFAMSPIKPYIAIFIGIKPLR